MLDQVSFGAQDARVVICLLGPFRILKLGRPLSIRSGGKAEHLLTCLAMHPQTGLTRDALIERVWPEYSSDLASQSLNTLTHWLKNQLSDALAGRAPILREQGRCSLNLDGGLHIDVLEFESAVASGQRFDTAGSVDAATESYESAVYLLSG
jgi:DNA-binding SARP family transcriptional activator